MSSAFPDPRASTAEDLSPRQAAFWVALFLGGLLLVPLVRHAGWPPSVDPWGTLVSALVRVPSELFTQSPLATNRQLQAAIDQVERQLEEGSPLLEAALPRVQQLMTNIGGVGNTKVLLGDDGWLFFRPGFDYVVGPPFLAPEILRARSRGGPSWLEPPVPDPRPAILDLHRQLQTRGISLLLLAVPTKAMARPGALSPAAAESDGPVLHNPSFGAFRADLERAGVHVVDATEVAAELEDAGTASFLRTDSHWSPELVDAVARVVGTRIDDLGLAFEAPRRAWREASESIVGTGDLVRLLEWPEPWPDEVEARLQKVATFDGRPWQADPRAEILLLGDSFSNVFSTADLGWGSAAGFGERLSFQLGRTLDRIAVNDGSATAVRERWATSLASGGRDLESLRLVIYQVAVRELSGGDWRVVGLVDVIEPVTRPPMISTLAAEPERIDSFLSRAVR